MTSKAITRNKIKARLIERGIKLVDIARELGVTRSAVSQALMSRLGSPRIRAEVAKRLNTTPDKLWQRAA